MALRLALYSDQIAPLTDSIDERLFSMLPKKPTIGYLPSSPDPDRSWFWPQANYYSRRGASLRFFGLESEFQPRAIPELLSCDAIHLTGGNTFQFQYWLRQRGMIDHLREYAACGGVLIGVSAGAILMTPDISTSYLCGDLPYTGVEEYAGLGLVDFAFVPHFDGPPGANRDVTNFAKRFGGRVYTVPDGGGIIIDGDQCVHFGDVRCLLLG